MLEQKWDKEISVSVIYPLKSMLSQELDVLIYLCLRKLIIYHFDQTCGIANIDQGLKRIFFIMEGNREDRERRSWGWGE